MTDSIRCLALIALIGASALAGCAHDPSPNVTKDFGKAVRAAQAAQTINPDASKNPDPVAGIDGVSGKTAADTYHKSFEAPPPTFSVINIGGAAAGGAR